MKIVGRVLISLAGAFALVSAAVVGCSTTNNLDTGGGTSDLGETCTRTFDCKSPYICEQNVCLKAAATTAPDGGVITGSDAGMVAMGPHLGLLNESCQTSSDCQAPLACIGQSCSIVSFGLTVSGKSCAECSSAADCCELPINTALVPGTYLDPWYAASVDGGLLVAHGKDGVTGNFATYLVAENLRCQDLLSFIGGDATICANPASFTVNETSLASACFVYNAYCGSCGANGPWACNGGQCVYTAPCVATGTAAAMAAGACPPASRLHVEPSTTCSSPDGGAGGACTAGCAVDSDCTGKTPTDANHACGAADAGGPNCACNNGACFLTCANDRECAGGKSCDPTTHLCIAGTCTTDAECITSLRSALGKCTMGTCALSCTKDTDCNAPTNICSSGSCKLAGCTSDIDCTGGGAHSFCVTAPPSTTTYSSAVTN
jgi:hypothetical protein